MLTYYENHRSERLIYQSNYNKKKDKEVLREYNRRYYYERRRFIIRYNDIYMEKKKGKSTPFSQTKEGQEEVPVVITYYDDPRDSPFIPFKIPR